MTVDTMSGRLRYLVVFVFAVASLLPGIAGLPPIDRDEARYVQSTKQMLETGDYVDIRFQDNSRYKKPVGIYWLQSASATLLGGGAEAPIWTYRIVSVLAMAMAAMAMLSLGTAMFGVSAGMVAALMFIGMFGIAFEGRLAKTDSTLVMLCIVAQASLARVYLASARKEAVRATWSWGFWVIQGLAILVKGPIAPLLSALTLGFMYIFDRFGTRQLLKDLKPLSGVLVAIAVVAPWLIMITVKSGGAFWQEALGRDLFGKVAGGQESHGAPPGYYILTYSLFVWPFGLLAVMGGTHALRRFRYDRRLLFLISWYVPFAVLFELVPTKLPHYMLPAYPALLLAGAWLMTEPEKPITLFWQRILHGLTAVGVGVVTLLLAAAVIAGPIYLQHVFVSWTIPAALLVLAAGWFGLGKRAGVSPVRRTAEASVAAILAYALIFGLLLPRIDAFWLSRQMADRFAEEKPCPDSILATAYYTEPSLVFLVGTERVETMRGTEVAKFLQENPKCGVVAITDSNQTDFFDALPGGETSVISGKPIVGVNYSKGRELTIRLYRMKTD